MVHMVWILELFYSSNISFAHVFLAVKFSIYNLTLISWIDQNSQNIKIAIPSLPQPPPPHGGGIESSLLPLLSALHIKLLNAWKFSTKALLTDCEWRGFNLKRGTFRDIYHIEHYIRSLFDYIRIMVSWENNSMTWITAVLRLPDLAWFSSDIYDRSPASDSFAPNV